MVDSKGRQFTMVLCSLPFTIGWLLILITHSITGPSFRPLLFAGRLIAGVGIGSISLVVPVRKCIMLHYSEVVHLLKQYNIHYNNASGFVKRSNDLFIG